MIDRAIGRELAALLRDHVELAAQCEKDAKFLLVLADDCEARAHYARSATQERWINRSRERSPGARRRRANAGVIGAIASVWSAVKLVSGVHIIADLPLGLGNVMYDYLRRAPSLLPRSNRAR
jgi:hypothetical protein